MRISTLLPQVRGRADGGRRPVWAGAELRNAPAGDEWVYVTDYLPRCPGPPPAWGAPAVEAKAGAHYLYYIGEALRPLCADDVRQETARDPLFLKVIRYVENGSLKKMSDFELFPYFRCQLELSIEKGYIMRGHKVVVPSFFHHFGVVKIKMEARNRMRCPENSDRTKNLNMQNIQYFSLPVPAPTPP
ncbi:hypothetical protein EVAR_97998_1 [Eumeta japonica]|uniref:Uncharacterized protein n=1 Tax=Eumeta variegata TaxID=151549 RepID=A0A4C1WM38_EUMVA|nr:hypothetical protein EVAR_97998_1 [Eumeta japonica]